MKSNQFHTVYGNFPTSLNISNLSDICVPKNGVQTGPFGSQLHQKDYVEKGVPIITVEHLGENKIVHVDTPFVSDDDYNRLIKYNLKKGDIVFSRVGSVDRRALVSEDEDGWLFSGRCLRVRPNNDIIDSVYLSYFFGLQVFKKYVRSIAVGATMPSINTKILSNLPVVYPPLSTQKKIAHILSTLDDKIELNRQMNKTLEAMSQALFKSWFVDFDPVHVKASCKSEEELEAGAKELGIAKEVLELFPGEFVESEMGMIPLGWEIGSFANDCKIVYGKNLPTTKLIDNGYEVYGGNGIIGFYSEYLYEKQQVLIACRGAASGVVYISNPYSFVTNNSLIIELPHEGILNFEYMSELARFSDFSLYRSGSAQPQITIQSINTHKFIIPDKGILIFWKQQVNIIQSSILANTQQIQTLQKTRDTLLPKLLSGELGVSEVEI